MILIADSGSTKTDWCIADKGNAIKQFQTGGTNPFFQTADSIADEIRNSLLPEVNGFDITAIYFYGAGCAFAEQRETLATIISPMLNAPVEVFSDLMAAARALCGRNAGIACILGTGSNSCLYDGVEIIEHVSPLGYILGDEGSGAVLGKRLVSDCLKKQLPAELAKKFMDEYKLTPEQLLNRVYKQPFPNRYLASFVPFLLHNITETPIYNIVYNEFSDFLIRNVMHYTNVDQYKIGFCGSIAYYFRDVMRNAIFVEGLQLGEIMKAPMNGLVKYHQ